MNTISSPQERAEAKALVPSQEETESQEVSAEKLLPGEFVRVTRSNQITQRSYRGEYYYPTKVQVGGVYRVITPWGRSGKTLSLESGLKKNGILYNPIVIDEATLEGRYLKLQGEELSRLQSERVEVFKYSASYQPFVKKLGVLMTGADPEIFVVNSLGEVIPAWTFLPSVKVAPLSLYNGHTDDNYTWGKMYYDGFQAEFAPKPVGCHTSLTFYFRQALYRILEAARKVDSSARLNFESVLPVPPKVLAEAQPEYVELGCAPSLNAYTGEESGPDLDVDPRMLPIRFAGCHVHFSGHMGSTNFTQLPPSNISEIVKAIDKIAGIASVSLFRQMDSPIRRQYYGRAGEYRRPAHGFEYRVLSSSVLASPVLTNLMLDLTRVAVGVYLGGDLGLFDLPSDEETQDIINNCDVERALATIRANEIGYLKLLQAIYGASRAAAGRALRLLQEGAVNLLDLSSVENNWRLGDSQWDTWEDYVEGKSCSMIGWRPPTQASASTSPSSIAFG